jgi:hypothetical protein
MTDRNSHIRWQAIVRGVAIVYGSTFLSGLVFAFTGITPQADRVAYPLLALLTGAFGVALALRAAETTRLSYLVTVGIGVWLLSSTSVLLGAQSFTGWLNSSVFIATTVMLGRLLLGVSLERFPTTAMSYSILTQKSHSAAQILRRAKPSRF